MSFELKFIPQAEETYDSVMSQLEDRWGTKFVEKFEAKVRKSLDVIVENPYLYPITDESRGARKCVLHKNCSMLYVVRGSHVVITYFWDNRQEPLLF